jgi:hypothetical protein
MPKSKEPASCQVLSEESACHRQPLLRWITVAAADDWQRLGLRYLDLAARWRMARPCHTDKPPSNWLLSGVLVAMLPAARIVDVRREALEAGWFCYKQ